MLALFLGTLFFSLVIKENEAQGKWDQYQMKDCSVVLLELLLLNLIFWVQLLVLSLVVFILHTVFL